MLVDVSHLSDPGFWDVAEELSGPFFASHSNARAVFSHPRNLTDEQFTAIIDHNGVVGLNLYANFLGERADLDTAIAHLEHWLELGGADRRFGRRSGRLFQPAGGDHGYSGSGPAVGAAAAAELQ